MRKMTVKMFASLVLIIFAISSFAQSEADIKQKIEKMNKDMAQAMIAGDHEKNLQFYTDDVISMPSYEKMLKGKEAIKNSMNEMAKSDWKIKDFNFETLSVETNDNVITEIGKYRMEMKKQGSEESMKDEGKYITLWEKQSDGSLKIKTEMWNSDNNPWAQMEHNKSMMGESRDKDADDINIDKRHDDNNKSSNSTEESDK